MTTKMMGFLPLFSRIPNEAKRAETNRMFDMVNCREDESKTTTAPTKPRKKRNMNHKKINKIRHEK